MRETSWTMNRGGEMAVALMALVMAVLALVAPLGSHAAAAEEAVLTITGKAEWDAALAAHPFLVAEFYAPWCGHCKKLAPEYESAAQALKEDPIKLAKIDATEEANKALASEMGVSGYPTLKIVRNGGAVVQDYNGPRESAGIVSFLRKQAGPAFKTVSDAAGLEAAKAAASGPVVTCGLSDCAAFKEVAEAKRDGDAEFVVLEGSAADGKVSVSRDASMYGSDAAVCDGECPTLAAFVDLETMPVVAELGPDAQKAVQTLVNSPLPKVLFLLDKSAAGADELIATFKALALANKGRTVSLFGDKALNKGAMDFFAIPDTPGNKLAMHDGPKKYVVQGDNVKLDTAQQFIDGVLDGSIKAMVKSAVKPDARDEGVVVATANSFEADVLQAGKPVMVEFYAPWCGHCKKLAPEYAKAAQHFEKLGDPVSLVKFDATANDVPDSRFDVKGFPTIYTVSASGDIATYNGARSSDGIIAAMEALLGASAGSHDEL